ncbi:hypothetical protein M1P56_03510 [Streptomyces sp. HU2014]|uniref:hypothetical protein n=1 Tax=Streptomyces sp. HU2014 TaxID=2939414 RepID=UPI00200DA5B7|nr:hypothetical protein [Streptomyces sp. HU2014]UQI43508.1 hypothetical protein M1P56_03510 [Streptomyces sp. HU2014]
MPVRYTCEMLVEVARASASYDEAVRRCGGTSTPGSRTYIRARMAELGGGLTMLHSTTASPPQGATTSEAQPRTGKGSAHA